MIVCISNLLTPDEIAHINTDLGQANFVPGQSTAGWHAKLVKQNEQAAKQPALEPLKAMIQAGLGRNSLFQAVAWPRTIHSILFSRYGVGMSYGRHTDNALMGGASFLRSDLSFTVFLSEPETYEGGELVVKAAKGAKTPLDSMGPWCWLLGSNFAIAKLSPTLSIG